MTLDELINNPELPSLPEALIRLNELINQDRPINEITEVIENEPSMSVRALELANSAWYKRSRQISTVKDAITIIGLDTLHQLVFASSVTRVFYGIDSQLVDMAAFWNQSLQLATTSKSICEFLNTKNSIQVFTCGIAVNIGKLLIYLYDPESANEIIIASKKQPRFQHRHEKQILGYTHSDVSAKLLEKWQIPESIYIPIGHYLEPMSAPPEYQQITNILYLSQQISCIGQSEQALSDAAKELAEPLEFLGVSENDLPQILSAANNSMGQAKSILGVA